LACGDRREACVTRITLEGVTSSYGSLTAVRDVTLAIASGEFFTLLGPSGCGKTTLLRSIAGFRDLDAGTIHFGAQRIDTLPPHRRNIGMVFQNYAVFPNLDVAGNVAYGLKARRVPSDAIRTRVEAALERVHLAGLGHRRPHQLSGGQLQRVAIARALVINPDVLLLDEPLSNLDARLRVDMRREIRELQQSSAITAVYVTHDQEEALSISDRIAVMREGMIEQTGEPAEIYRAPRTRFVAEFMGVTNVLTGVVSGRAPTGAVVRAAGIDFSIADAALAAGERAMFCLRPEALRLVRHASDGEGFLTFEAVLLQQEFLGVLRRLVVRLPDGTPLHVAVLDRTLPDQLGEGPLRLAYDPSSITLLK
jgi:ABC-type Fe3+/spermidine/putrescine transport system ATPase subunit